MTVYRTLLQRAALLNLLLAAKRLWAAPADTDEEARALERLAGALDDALDAHEDGGPQ